MESLLNTVLLAVNYSNAAEIRSLKEYMRKFARKEKARDQKIDSVFNQGSAIMKFLQEHYLAQKISEVSGVLPEVN